MSREPSLPSQPLLDDELVEQLLELDEGKQFEVKRITGDKLTRASWDQLWAYIETHGSITNADLRKLLKTKDTLRVSKFLRQLVDARLLVVANPNAAKQHRRYKLPEQDLSDLLFSKGLGKQAEGKA